MTFTSHRWSLVILLILTALSLPVKPAVAQPCPHDGDVNQDGVITPADALLAFQHFLEIADPTLDECQQNHADVVDPVDPGSDITPGDALCIFQEFLELPSCLDPGDTEPFVLDESPLDDPMFRLQ